MATKTICDIEPFRYQSTPQPEAESGASGSEINQQAIEDYLNRLREAICADIESIIDECCDGGGGGGGGTSEFTGLTDTPSSYTGDGGLIVQVKADESGLEFASAGGGADSDGLVLDYSTSEQTVNRTWVGGETIYQKTINFGSLPNNTSKTVAHGITNLERVIAYQGVAYESSSGNNIPMPFVSLASLSTEQVLMYFTSTNIIVATGTNRTGYDLYVTLFYTKSS